MVQAKPDIVTNNNFVGKHLALTRLCYMYIIMSGLLSHSKNSTPVWFCLFWWAEELYALSYALLQIILWGRSAF